MPHTVIYNSEERIIEMKFQGVISLNEVKEITNDVVILAKEMNCFLVLSDYRETDLNLSAAQIYNIPQIISGISAEVGAYRFKRAVVVARDFEDFDFYETVSLNQAQLVKVFKDIDEAKNWLTK